MLKGIVSVLTLFMGLAGMFGLEQPDAADAAMAVRVVNTGGAGVSLRTRPVVNARQGYGAPEGATVTAECYLWGEAVGPYANRLWWQVSYAGRRFVVADRYLSTPNRANQPPPGQPQCGVNSPRSTPTPTPPAVASGDAPLVWIGSPVDGRWAWLASSLPQQHHITYGGDWSVDLPAAKGQPVVVYAAPQDNRTAITARVESVAPACRSRVIGDGGYQVVVGFYAGGTKVGQVVYAHVNPTVSAGQTISRWGSRIGTVGSFRHDPIGCWDGEHAHVELFSTRHYACFNKGFGLQQAVHPSNFIGFIGGNVASGPRSACR